MCIISYVYNHHYKLFPILFIVFNDDFIIEIMIVLYCVYINTTYAIPKHCNIFPFYLFFKASPWAFFLNMKNILLNFSFSI